MAIVPHYPFTAPLLLVSGLVCALGITAAWNFDRQQANSNEVITREVESVVTVHRLEAGMRDVRWLLGMYLRSTEDELESNKAEFVSEVQSLHQQTKELLAQARAFASDANELATIDRVQNGYGTFFADFEAAIQSNPVIRRNELNRLTYGYFSDEILTPLKQLVDVEAEIVHKTNLASRGTTTLMRTGFLVLGIVGGAAGLLFGAAMARKVHQSMVQLNVSVVGAADKLEEVIGPVSISTAGGLTDLQVSLKEIEKRITQLVEDLRKREREMMRHEQLAVVGQLAAGLAHELRNPLMPMKMLVQNAMERCRDQGGPGLEGRQLNVLNEEIGRLEESIRFFLDFARPPTVERRHCDLAKIVRETSELIEHRAQNQRVEIRLQLPEESAELHADPNRIRQLLLNLLLNSLDALPDGGVVGVTVAADQASREDPWGSENREPIQEGWRISVSDNGSGFQPDALSSAFEPFVTTKETGTGLGLSICKTIVEAHSGAIRVQNLPTGGARFEIWLPQ